MRKRYTHGVAGVSRPSEAVVSNDSRRGRHDSATETTTASSDVITPEMDRINGLIFFVSYVLVYLAAPVIYVDVVQAALCDKLGASTAVANLPASAFLFAVSLR
jgi:hypothetical protein